MRGEWVPEGGERGQIMSISTRGRENKFSIRYIAMLHEKAVGEAKKMGKLAEEAGPVHAERVPEGNVAVSDEDPTRAVGPVL